MALWLGGSTWRNSKAGSRTDMIQWVSAAKSSAPGMAKVCPTHMIPFKQEVPWEERVRGGQAAAESQEIMDQQAYIAHDISCLGVVKCWWRWVYYNLNLLSLTAMQKISVTGTQSKLKIQLYCCENLRCPIIFLGTALQIHLVCGLCRLSNPLNAPNLHI